MFFLNVVDLYFVSTTILRIVSGQTTCFFKGTVRKFIPAAFDDNVRSRSTLCMEPPVIAIGKRKSKFFILQVVLSNVHIITITGNVMHWFAGKFNFFLCMFSADIAALHQFLFDLGKIRFAHDDELKHVSVNRLTLAIASLSFAVYMFPGMFGAPLKALSGYLPPMHTQDFVINTQGVVAAPSATAQTTEKIKYADILHWPYDLPGYFDLAQAEAAAREADKPLFVDITGISCVNCREMEARVWSDPRVQQILRDDYVLVALYTDDKTKVPENEWVTTAGGKVLKDIGRINSYIAQTRFGVNGQPNYLILGRDGQELVPKRAYNLDVEAYIDFLKSGVEAYNKTK